MQRLRFSRISYSLAALYLTLHAHLLASLQLIVYAGAVVVLFVFVIMLIGPVPVTPTGTRSLLTRVFSGAVMAMVTTGLIASVADVVVTRPGIEACPPGTAECVQYGGVKAFGEVLYGAAALPFELVSILLLVAILGAIAVGRGRSQEETEHLRLKKASRQLANESASNGAQAASEHAAAE